MKLFNKPNWLKPELNEPLYWLHLVILATVALAILQYFFGGNMFTFWNVIKSVPILAVGDTAAHSILQLD